MRKRIESLPAEVKGVTHLKDSLERLEEEFNESGYEMENLLGMHYFDGMKIEAKFIKYPGIPNGEERIVEVLQPEIKYNGEVIMAAKVNVGKSY
jgi:hypothetical protein